MDALIERFVSELALEDDHSIRFRGAVVHAPPADPSDAQQRLRLALTECTYKYFYTHPDGQIGDAFRQHPDDADLIAAFSTIGTCRELERSRWIVDNLLEDGSIIASRHAKMQKFLPGQYLAEPDQIPLTDGSEVTVITRSRSRTQQPGFFFFFSHARLDLAEIPPMVRLYWNVRREGAAELARILVETLNTHAIVFNLKLATRASEYSRRDCAVLYLPRRMYRVATLALTSSVPRLRDLLCDGEPAFTRHLLPGVGLAEDPGTGTHSFGSSRCELIADSILAARRDRHVPVDRFRSQLEASLHARGLRSDALYLNPNSEDIYDVSDLWRAG